MLLRLIIPRNFSTDFCPVGQEGEGRNLYIRATTPDKKLDGIEIETVGKDVDSLIERGVQHMKGFRQITWDPSKFTGWDGWNSTAWPIKEVV